MPKKTATRKKARKPAAKANKPARPLVGITMGSISDWDTMKRATAVLEELGIPYERRVVSAHRTPEEAAEYARSAASRGLKVIIAGAGGAAHLAGVFAAFTEIPVLAVPIQSKALQGLDSLLSMVQMPAGIPVPTFAIGTAGAANAALTAGAIIALSDAKARAKLKGYRRRQTAKVLAVKFPD